MIVACQQAIAVGRGRGRFGAGPGLDTMMTMRHTLLRGHWFFGECVICSPWIQAFHVAPTNWSTRGMSAGWMGRGSCSSRSLDGHRKGAHRV